MREFKTSQIEAPAPVLRPQRLKVDGQAYRAAAVHFSGFAIQLWDPDVRRGGGVGGRYIKFEIKFVLLECVYVPALAGPVCAVLIGCDGEPVGIRSFVELDIVDEGFELLCRLNGSSLMCRPCGI